jgi:hypothetical protein
MAELTTSEQEREKALQEIADLIDGVARRVARRHYHAPTQEHQLSAKLAEAIEEKLAGLKTPLFTMGVAVQDFPDKGKGAWERPTGADLYISIVREDDDEELDFSKGMLVQSKWDRTFFPHRKDVREQCERMLARTESSYVWVFAEDRVWSFPARQVIGSPSFMTVQTVGQQIAAGLRCHQGDVAIGRDREKPLDRGLNDIMRDLAEREIYVDESLALTLVRRTRTGKAGRVRKRQ